MTVNNRSHILIYMTQQQYLKTIEQQLQRINDTIDAKIMKGIPYVVESKKHKALLQKLRTHRQQNSIFYKMFFHFFQA